MPEAGDHLPVVELALDAQLAAIVILLVPALRFGELEMQEYPQRLGVCKDGFPLVELGVHAPDGSLVATVPYWWRGGPKRPGVVHVLRSSDGGMTWERQPVLEYFTAMPWLHDGALYLFAHRDGRGKHRNDDLVLHRSEDGGRTWSNPVTLFEGHFWNCPTSIVFAGGHVYRAFDQLDVPGRAERVVAGDLSRDLMNPGAWRISPPVPFPGAVPELCRGGRCGNSRWLEPNVIQIGERLRVLSRVEMDAMATANICGVCDLSDEGGKLSLKFAQYYPMPGGQCKFHIA
jgi:hypothetical protein